MYYIITLSSKLLQIIFVHHSISESPSSVIYFCRVDMIIALIISNTFNIIEEALNVPVTLVFKAQVFGNKISTWK